MKWKVSISVTIFLFWEWPHLISHKSFIFLLLVTHLISCQCFKHSPKSSSVRRRRRSRQERKSNIYRKCRLEHEQSLLQHLPPPKGRTTYKNWITTPTQEDTSSVALNLYTFECMMSFLALGRVTLMLCTFTVICERRFRRYGPLSFLPHHSLSIFMILVIMRNDSVDQSTDHGDHDDTRKGMGPFRCVMMRNRIWVFW